jgi:hypothetical protein
MVSYIEGMLKIANLFLALIAGGIGLSIIRHSIKERKLAAWKYLAIALVLFAFQEILGALRAFNIFRSPFLTHVNVSVLLAFLLIALVVQINVTGRSAK